MKLVRTASLFAAIVVSFSHSVVCGLLAAQEQVEAVPKSHDKQPEALYRGRSFSLWKTSLQSDLDPTYRRLAIKAIGEFGANGRETEAIELIEPFLLNNDYNTTTQAIGAMVRCGAQAAPALARLLEIPDYERKGSAAFALVSSAGPAASPYLDSIVSVAKSSNDKFAVSGCMALIALGEETDEVLEAVHATLCRFATPKRGTSFNTEQARLLKAFGKSSFSAATNDRIFLRLFLSGNPFEKQHGGALISRYASNDENIRDALTEEYGKQLRNNEKRFVPSINGHADSSFLLSCQLKALSNIELTNAPPTKMIMHLINDLGNMRHNFDLRNEKGEKPGPRGNFDPATHPELIPFLVRLLKEVPFQTTYQSLLSRSVGLLGDFGEEAATAAPHLVELRKKVKLHNSRTWSLLNKSLEKTIVEIGINLE